MEKLDLKPGDDVIVHLGFDTIVRKVDRITPSGRIIVGESTYNPDGTQRGAALWQSMRITKASPGEVEQLKRLKFTRSVLAGMRDCRSITYEQAVEIDRILNK